MAIEPGARSRTWWVFALRGALAVLFGVTAWVWPGLTLTALVFLIGAYALVEGGFAVAAGVSARDGDRRWWAEVLVGAAGVLLGILTFAWPGLTALVLLSLIAAWAVVTGALEIVTTVQLREAITDEWFLGLAGLASVAFGVVLFLFPGAGALGLVLLIGAYAAFFGVLLIALSARLRGMDGAAAVAAIRGREIGPDRRVAGGSGWSVPTGRPEDWRPTPARTAAMSPSDLPIGRPARLAEAAVLVTTRTVSGTRPRGGGQLEYQVGGISN